MRTRREQVQAYRFVTRRIVSALLSGEPETNNLPMRRLGLALFGSVMVGAIVLAGVGVYGLLNKSRAPLETDTLVIERETGAAYVYLDGRLYPTLNYVSARLILATPEAKVRTMSQASLQGRPRGRAVGIAGAPNTLPPAAKLLRPPWQICQVPHTVQPGAARAVIGRELAGAQPLGDKALLVRSGDIRYLLWNNTRLRISGSSALAALGLSSVEPVQVGQQMINALTAGPDLRAIPVRGSGEVSSRPVGGQPARVGEVFRSAGQHYVLGQEGLMPIGEITARLRLAAGGTVREITPQAAGTALAGSTIEPPGLPPVLPQLYAATQPPAAVCVAHRDPTGRMPLTTTVEVFTSLPADLAAATADAVDVPQGPRDAVRAVDQVVMNGGQAAVVRAIAGSAAATTGTTVYLVVDGVKYPFGQRNGDARSALGYGGVQPLPVPAAMLALVPTGPTLDIAAAKRFAADNAGAGRAPAVGTPAPAAGQGSPAPGASAGAVEAGEPDVQE